MILLTGSGGQVGMEIARRAQALSLPICALARQDLDIADEAAVRQAVADCPADLIVNAAAYTAVDRAEDEPEAAFRVNRDGAALLADVAGKAGIPLVHLSTDYVFDGTGQGPCKVSEPAAPIGIYGQSKWAGEEAVRQRLSRHLIIRVSWVFGVYGSNFVKSILKAAATRESLRVVADQRGGPTYAGHIADLILVICRRIANDAAIPWGTYHFSGAPATTWHGFAKAVIREGRRGGIIDHPVTVYPIATKDYPTRARRPANSVLDCSRLKTDFGVAQPSWEAGLTHMIQSMAEES